MVVSAASLSWGVLEAADGEMDSGVFWKGELVLGSHHAWIGFLGFLFAVRFRLDVAVWEMEVEFARAGGS